MTRTARGVLLLSLGLLCASLHPAAPPLVRPVAELLAPSAQAQTYQLVCVVGDSESKGVAGASPMYWEYLNADRPSQKFTATGHISIGGRRCDQLLTEVFQVYVVSAAGKSYGCTKVIIQCGVNDAMQSYTADQVCNNANSPVKTMVTAARTAGIPVILIGVGPWGAHNQWTAAKQTQTLGINTCMQGLATTTSPAVTYVDAYTILGQPGTPTNLNTNWDDIAGAPDGLHWDTEGARALATGINATGAL